MIALASSALIIPYQMSRKMFTNQDGVGEKSFEINGRYNLPYSRERAALPEGIHLSCSRILCVCVCVYFPGIFATKGRFKASVNKCLKSKRQ